MKGLELGSSVPEADALPPRQGARLGQTF
jgi:hypothetical protein